MSGQAQRAGGAKTGPRGAGHHQAAEQVTWTVLDAITPGLNSEGSRVRYILGFAFDNRGQPSLPHVQTLADGQMVDFMAELTQHITNHDVALSDAQLAALATACTQQLTQRAQFHERKAKEDASTGGGQITIQAMKID